MSHCHYHADLTSKPGRGGAVTRCHCGTTSPRSIQPAVAGLSGGSAPSGANHRWPGPRVPQSLGGVAGPWTLRVPRLAEPWPPGPPATPPDPDAPDHTAQTRGRAPTATEVVNRAASPRTDRTPAM